MSKVSMGWGDAFKSIPGDKIAAEAAIGGVTGMGLNYAANSSSGESGGYLGAAVMGAGVGAAARGTMKKMGFGGSKGSADNIINAAGEGSNNSIATNIIDKSVNVFTKGADMAVARSSTLRNAVDNSPGLLATRNFGQSNKSIFASDSNFTTSVFDGVPNTNRGSSPVGASNYMKGHNGLSMGEKSLDPVVASRSNIAY